MGRKILKVEKDPEVTSECWTYYKLAIIQTMSQSDYWICSHMQMYINDWGGAEFGDNGIMYPLSYFSDVLEISEENILDISPEKIPLLIIDNINRDNYIIMDLNQKRVDNIETTSFWIHEALIYGYDDEHRAFNLLHYTNGKFQDKLVPYDQLCIAFNDVFNYYSKNKESLFYRKEWYTGITIVKPKEKYKNPNAFFDFIVKLRHEIEGNIYTKTKYLKGVEYKYHTGLASIKCFSEIVRKYIENNNRSKDDVFRYIKSFTKIYEHQKIILRGMKAFATNIQLTNVLISSIVYEYEKCCEQMHIIIFMLLKFIYTSNVDILKRIIKQIEVIRKCESVLIEKYIDETVRLYIEKMI